MTLIKTALGENDFARFSEAVAVGENIAKGETGLGAFLTCETLFAPSVINQIRCLKDINELVPHIESALEAQQAIIERLQRDLSKEKLCTSLTRVLHANKRTFAALKNAFGEWKGAYAKGENLNKERKLQEL
jgi:hypothetical protein